MNQARCVKCGFLNAAHDPKVLEVVEAARVLHAVIYRNHEHLGAAIETAAADLKLQLGALEPAPRFVAEEAMNAGWLVRNVTTRGVTVATFSGPDAERHAREHAARLNAEGR